MGGSREGTGEEAGGGEISVPDLYSLTPACQFMNNPVTNPVDGPISFSCVEALA